MNEDIRTYRIGNEVHVRWPILTNGQEETLTGRKISLFLTDPMNNISEITNFGTEGNVIVWTFPATEQKLTGIYTLTVFENLGSEHQTATDFCRAFRLVARSCEIPSSMQVGELPLASTNMEVGIKGQSAYEIAVRYGYEGSEEQWMSQFNTVLNSTQLITESVEQAQNVLQRTEQLFTELSDIQQAEQTRVQNENERGSAETTRRAKEQERQDAESLRQQAETERSTAEEARALQYQRNEQERERNATESEYNRNTQYQQAEAERNAQSGQTLQGIQQAEQGRVAAENLRVEAENERSSHESTRVSNEGTRQENELNRTDAETLRRTAETRRVAAEDERVAAEVLRKRAENERVANDAALALSEGVRVSAESSRNEAEYQRAQAELVRNLAEQQRQQSVQQAIAAFNHTERVLTQAEFDAIVLAGELVEGCDYKIIEEEETE